MSAPEPPIQIDVPDGSTVLVADDGVAIYRADAESPESDDWHLVRREDHDALDTLATDDPDVDPPVFGEFRVTVKISAPVERVFEYVSDVRTHEEYADFVDTVEIRSEDAVGEDVVFVQIHENSTERIETEMERYEPHEAVGWVTRKDAGDIHIRYWFEPIDGGTLVTHAGVAPLATESADEFSADLAELQERYENNLTEMANLQAVFD